MAFSLFLLQAVLIALSGTIAPGPITAVTVGKGSESPRAGTQVALGHIGVEGLLILAIWAGLGLLRESVYVRAGIGFIGGLLLAWMAVGMLQGARRAQEVAPTFAVPAFVAGVSLTAANPYFLLWWGTVGSSLILRAVEFGLLGLAAFALAHWACDWAWLRFLSGLSFRGGRFFGQRFQRIVFGVCGLFLLLMAAVFVVDAVRTVRAG